MNRHMLALGVMILVCLGPAWSQAQAQFVLGPDFDPAEPVETLTVRIDIGPDGDDLEEPVALDLGLGFPFWLHPTGREGLNAVPFGAIPQQTTAGATVAAGSSATFTFCLADEPGQDFFQSTSQLLAGVQVSDVARIGFSSPGANDWVLRGYEIQINERVFASNTTVDLRAQGIQESGRFELADTRLAMAPLEAERGDLIALAEAELATDEDVARLAEVEEELIPLAWRRDQLEAQVAGRFPWFEEPDFCPPWRDDAGIGSARVTLVTYDHPGAESQNRVYFRTGGHKYLLNPGAELLSGAFGAQTFDLDLMAGPLTAADIRGYAVGMLAHDQPYGDAPDRWHPARVLVELDGRIVYDSDESPIDHDSLAAIRLIPPIHLDAAGNFLANLPTALETFVWQAGSALGLDLAGGGAFALPDEDDPLFPGMESGLIDVGLDLGYGDPGYGLFPGEYGWPYDDGFCPGDYCPGWDSGWGPPPPWLDFLFNEILPDPDPFPDDGDPPAAGDSFQIDNVRIIAGWQMDDTFTVAWTVSGDESAIDHYDVSLLPVHPDLEMPFGAPLATEMVAPGVYEVDIPMPMIMVADPLYYLAPIVVADPVDPADTPHERIGPAVALFPAGASPLDQLELQNVYLNYPPIGPPAPGPVSFGGEPAGADRAVWSDGEVESHNAILFDVPSPAWNVGVRPEAGDLISVSFVRPALTDRHRVVAHVGFLHGADAANEVEVRMQCSLEPDGGPPPSYDYPEVGSGPLVNPAVGPVEPMRLLEQEVDAGDAPWAGNVNLVITFTFDGGAVDAAHPPALFGVRLVPIP